MIDKKPWEKCFCLRWQAWQFRYSFVFFQTILYIFFVLRCKFLQVISRQTYFKEQIIPISFLKEKYYCSCKKFGVSFHWYATISILLVSNIWILKAGPFLLALILFYVLGFMKLLFHLKTKTFRWNDHCWVRYLSMISNGSLFILHMIKKPFHLFMTTPSLLFPYNGMNIASLPIFVNWLFDQHSDKGY